MRGIACARGSRHRYATTFAPASAHAVACRRMPTHADACRRMPTHADACRRMPTHADSDVG
ncbi:hypothetical protein WJ07_23985 [Burkholderia vietnamiensis]|nr:hypothetical protein WJ07_23985 [Burkholderia vietnamiensis]